jgi:4-hydroxyphenylpyruvate dioxygenase
MRALTATSYDGLLSLEIFNDQFRAGSARSVAIDGHRSLIYLLDQIDKSGMARQWQPALPPRSKCLGTEFIEFAIDEEGAAEFERLLSGLGFCKAGEHISKSVTRWTQGQINIVVNTEKEGFAHSFNITHGTAVCAIGLKVEDAPATLDRAQQLLDVPFRQAVGAGELEIPAVRGLGGSLVYFTDPKSDLARVWDIEFKAPAVRDQSSAGLTVVDHISQSMHYEEMLTWLLFYTSLLELAKLPEQDVLDPGGLVKSQVVQSEDGAIRIVLNASQSGQTQSSRFLSEAFGSGVQHIAFATNDIMHTAKSLIAAGVPLLPIPANYYDDLEAKYDLSVDDIDRLKAHNILYDREGEGEFFQLYTQTFADRFFFEIVDRSKGYQGFGAPNAQVRLTAQTRFSGQKEALVATLLSSESD